MTESTKHYRALQLHHPAQLVDEMIHSLKCMAQAGCSGFDCAEESLQVISRWGKLSDDARKPAPGKPVTGRETLKEIRADLGDCRRCKLCDSRNSIVFGQGSEKARLVFVGEGPGAEEDRQGVPFVGAAGQLLTKIIQAIKMTREEVYICNIIKCRPPGNRNPQPDEISACAPFLRRQLKAIAPDYICALGSFAAKTLLETGAPVSKLRGRLHDYMGIKLLPTYHPAFLLRSPDRKRDVWEDMKILMRAMGVTI
jgi:uracil-DNA glycosylase family 4